jgi:hypothetical protein
MDWRKSSHSADQGNCAETASAAGSVLVRDSNDRAGVTLAIPARAWRALTAQLRVNQAGLPNARNSRDGMPTKPAWPGRRFRVIIYVCRLPTQPG